MPSTLSQMLTMTAEQFEAYVDGGKYCPQDTIDLWVEATRLRTGLKNFLAAFDHYIGCSVTPSFTLSEIADAKQAMFSAANQARKVLE